MPPQNAQTHTPQEAIQAILDGNARYRAGRPTANNAPETLFELESGQSPFAGILRCADSRVAPEIVFDQPLGNLFSCAVAGNLPTSEVVASLEYAVLALGTPAIVVMGHTGCGAVGAAIGRQQGADPLPGSLPALIEQVELPADDEDPVLHNARQSAKRLVERSKVLRDRVESGELAVRAGVLDISTGVFSLIPA